MLVRANAALVADVGGRPPFERRSERLQQNDRRGNRETTCYRTRRRYR